MDTTKTADMYQVYKDGYKDIEGVPQRYESYLGNPASTGFFLTSTNTGVRSWAAVAGGAMVYPGPGIPIAGTGVWGTSITPTTGYMRYNGTTFEFKNDVYLTSVTAHSHAWSDITSGVPSTFAPSNHNLIDITKHPVSGLTTGHFLKSTGATTYGFAAHGLTYSDVGAAPSSVVSFPGFGTSSSTVAYGDHTHDIYLLNNTSDYMDGTLTCSGDIIAYGTP